MRSPDVHREERVCVVDEDFARRYWPHESAVGHQVFQGGDDGHAERAFTIVGVVGAVKQADVTETQAQGAVYFPLSWRADGTLFVVTRTAQDADAFGVVMTKIVRRLDPDVPVAGIRSMEIASPTVSWRGGRPRCSLRSSRASRCSSRQSARTAC